MAAFSRGIGDGGGAEHGVPVIENFAGWGRSGCVVVVRVGVGVEGS